MNTTQNRDIFCSEIHVIPNYALVIISIVFYKGTLWTKILLKSQYICIHCIYSPLKFRITQDSNTKSICFLCDPTEGISTLTQWWGLCGQMIQRPSVASGRASHAGKSRPHRDLIPGWSSPQRVAVLTAHFLSKHCIKIICISCVRLVFYFVFFCHF